MLLSLDKFPIFCFDIELTFPRPVTDLTETHILLDLSHLLSFLNDHHLLFGRAHLDLAQIGV
jgi:hypothetical protein